LCETGSPTHQLLNTLWNLSASGLVARDLERCLHHAHRLLEMAARASDRVWQAAAHRLIGMAYQRQFRIPEARRSLETALDTYRQSHKPKGCALTLQTLGHIETSVGNYRVAIETYRQAYEIYEQMGDLHGRATEALNLAFAAGAQADFVAQAQYAQQALTQARQIGDSYLEAIALQDLGESARETGDFGRASQYLQDAWSLLSDPTLLEERTGILAELALTNWQAGDLAAAFQAAGQVLENYPKIEGSDNNLHRYLWAAVRVLHAAGQNEQANQALAQAYHAFTRERDAIPEAGSRQAYQQLSYNHQLAAAYEHGRLP